MEAGKRLEELNISSDNQVEAESAENRADALRQTEEERKAPSASRKLLGELLLKAQEEAIAKAAIENFIWVYSCRCSLNHRFLPGKATFRSSCMQGISGLQ